MDPLNTIPAEIVIHILDFSTTSSIAQLTRLNKSWHRFIDETYQENIFSSKGPQPPGSPGFISAFSQSTAFMEYYETGPPSKEVCKAQKLCIQSLDVLPDCEGNVQQSFNETMWSFVEQWS